MWILWHDVRTAVRSLSKTPRLAGMALACIVIGLGATVSVLTLINALLVRQPPFPEADRLVRVWASIKDLAPRYDLSYLDYRDIRDQATSFERLEGVARTRLTPRLDDATVRLRGEGVSSGYFDLIGVEPAKGRLFAPREYRSEAPRLILIGHHLWKTSFGSDPDIVGRVLTARSVWDRPDAPSVAYTVIGVMPPGFVGTIEEDESHFWIPLDHYVPIPFMEERETDILWTLGRLKPGVTFEEADQEVRTIGQRLLASYPNRPGSPGTGPDDPQFALWAQPFAENWRGEMRRGLHLLLAASCILLVIACTNVAHLLLARLARLEHELSLRLILGAGRGRILRRLLSESLVLALIGGAGGTLLASWGIRAAVAVLDFEVPSYVDLSLDGRLVAVAVLSILVTGAAFGALPAWRGSQLRLSSRLRAAGRGLGSRRQAAFGRSLVAAEIALTFVLLSAAGLMLRSYANISRFDYGFRTDHLLRMSVTLNRGDLPEPSDWRAFMRRARQAVESHPGVRRAPVICSNLPPWRPTRRDLVGAAGETFPKVSRYRVTRGFFEAMGIDLLHGRDLHDSDDENGAPVALVSRSLARALAGEDARDVLGQEIRVTEGREAGTYQVVGVVEDISYGPVGQRDTKYGGPVNLQGHWGLYISAWQATSYVLSLPIHTEVDPASLIGPLRKVLGELAPTSPVHWISTMDEEVAVGAADTRLYTLLIGVYTFCAVLLAVLGIYGVLSHHVARRVGELGVRMALGAARVDILRLVIGQGLATVVIGVAVGGLVASAVLRLVSSLLYGVTPGDPGTFLLVAFSLVLLATLACVAPAMRAVRLDPAVALREE